MAPGFWVLHLVTRLLEMGCRDVMVPRSREFDLRQADAVERLFAEYKPQIVIHAAAVVGGIGANRANPGRFFFENAMMGLLVIDAARRHETRRHWFWDCLRVPETYNGAVQ